MLETFAITVVCVGVVAIYVLLISGKLQTFLSQTYGILVIIILGNFIVFGIGGSVLYFMRKAYLEKPTQTVAETSYINSKSSERKNRRKRRT